MSYWKLDIKAAFKWIERKMEWERGRVEKKQKSQSGNGVTQRGTEGKNGEVEMKEWTLASFPFILWPPVLCTQQGGCVCARLWVGMCVCLLPCMWFRPAWILRVAWSARSSFTLWPAFLHVRYVWVCGSEAEAPAAESSVEKTEGETSQ